MAETLEMLPNNIPAMALGLVIFCLPHTKKAAAY